MRTWCWLLLLVLAACKNDELPPPPIIPSETGKTVFVLNEGNFQWGNASLSTISLSNHSVNADVFDHVNQRPLGDVLNSAVSIGNELWLVVNNSQKIERIDPKTAEALTPVTGLHSPRFALEVAPGKVYVTDLYADRIHCVSSSGSLLPNSIETGGWTEELLLTENLVWVCNTDRNLIQVIDPSTDVIVDSVAVGDGPRSIRKDHQGKIWVLCEGRVPPNETAGSLWKIDPITRSVVRQFAFGSAQDHPSRLQTDASGEEIYFLLNGVMRMSVNDTLLPDSPWLAANGRLLYGLGIAPHEESVWVSDALDYQQQGKVYRYDQGKNETGVWNVGIIPGSFYFY